VRTGAEAARVIAPSVIDGAGAVTVIVFVPAATVEAPPAMPWLGLVTATVGIAPTPENSKLSSSHHFPSASDSNSRRSISRKFATRG
jgi:hypothetical protein